ncbi:MAG: thiamine pyrophosphate-dependent enzyme [Acidobacteriaceae bacterium]
MTGKQTQPSPALAGKRGFSLISDETFRQLYAALLQCELLDQRLRSARGYEPWTGREAASAAVSACLRRGDSITPTPRGRLAGYLHNGTLAGAGASTGPARQLAAANQQAVRHKRESNGNAVVVFAAVAPPSSMSKVFAAAAGLSLPVLYILQGATPPAEACHGIPVILVDASDAVALYRVACESITRAREGGGPTILECAAWPADPEPADPLRKLEQYLAQKKLFRPHWKRSLETKFSAALDEAITSLHP